MSRRATVELFEEIRREYHHGSGTIKGVADKLGVHRRMVRQALSSAVPPPAKERGRQKPVLSGLTPFIDQILEADQEAPRKQQHTAHRIWVRAQSEMGVTVAESGVRRYVRQRKIELDLSRRETFVPQCYAPGQEGQVDWYEAEVDFRGHSSSQGHFPLVGAPAEGVDRVTVQVFAMRAMYSGAAFHIAFPHATQLAFLEAHEAAFAHFGGVFGILRYDNLTSAVKKILRGYQRDETQRFTAFRSHWGFTSEFCNPARGNEKGGVEGELGYFRRNHLVPVPLVGDWTGLNQLLRAACVANGARRIGERTECVDALWNQERSHLQAAASEGFDLGEVLWPKVDKRGSVRVKTNSYSTPLRPGTLARVLLRAAQVEVWQDNRRVALHVRCYERNQQILNLEHYLDVLGRKPGAMANSIPLAQARAQGRWPACFDVLWQRLQERHGRMKGTQQLIELLLLAAGRSQGMDSARSNAWTHRPAPTATPAFDRLRLAVERALQLGTADVEAIRLLLDHDGLALVKGKAPPAPLQNQGLTPVQQAHFERPLPDTQCYDRLRPSVLAPVRASGSPALQLVGPAKQEVA